MKTKIYLVRHCEVENPNHIYYVWLPRFNLSKTGEFQAQKLKEFFANKKIAEIYSSPLLRARRTAKIVAGNKKVHYSRQLTEANYKKWQGLSAKDRPYKELRDYISHPEKINYLGEKLAAVQDRMIKEITKLAKRHPGKEIIIVSHADPIISARLFYEGRPLGIINKITLKNASITSLSFNEKLECKQVKYLEIVPAKEEGV